MKKGKLKDLFPILAILFLGYLGFSLALPIFPPLFLDPVHPFFNGTTTPYMRNVLLGVLLAMYPMGQFIGCPLVGKLSDRFGRKKILLISIVAIIPTYIASALSITYHLPIILFLARFLCGLLEGNIVIAQAAMADLSEGSKEKSRYFGWGVAASSLAFVLGPLLGGKLSDPDLVSFFNFATPFWLAAIVFAFMFLYMALGFRETSTPSKEISLSPLKIFSSIYQGTKLPKLRPIYGMNLLLFIAIFFFFSFLPIFLVDKFAMDASTLSESVAYLSVPIAIAPFFEGQLSKRLSPAKATILSALILGLGMLILIPPASSYALLATLIPPGLAIAWALTYTAVMVSETVNSHMQGEALGVNQSLQVFAEAGTSIIGGFLAGQMASLPLIVGALFAFLGAGALVLGQRKRPS